MKKLFNKWILPVCLLVIVLTQLLTYYMKKEINMGLWVIVVALTPTALKGLDINISKYLEWLLTIIAGLLLIFAILHTIW